MSTIDDLGVAVDKLIDCTTSLVDSLVKQQDHLSRQVAFWRVMTGAVSMILLIQSINILWGAAC